MSKRGTYRKNEHLAILRQRNKKRTSRRSKPSRNERQKKREACHRTQHKGQHQAQARDIAEVIGEILDSNFWLPSIKTGREYRCLHDDHEGTGRGHLHVCINGDGDAYIWITHQDGQRKPPVLRFRMQGFGGGESPRTRVALMILAVAMGRDSGAEQVLDNAPNNV